MLTFELHEVREGSKAVYEVGIAFCYFFRPSVRKGNVHMAGVVYTLHT